MNKLTFTLALAALLLGGCAQFHDRHHRGDGRFYGGCPCPDPTQPMVTVKDGAIVLDQEVLVFPRNVSGPLTWTLPSNSTVRFAENGIVIEGRLLDRVLRSDVPSVVLDPKQSEIVDCRRGSEGLSFTCLNRHTAPGVYKYTIRVIEGQREISRDPPIVNM